MTIHDINEYRKAQVIVEELEKALQIIKATDAGLGNYMKYRPVAHILTTLKEERPIIEMYLEKYKIIVETKGQNGI